MQHRNSSPVRHFGGNQADLLFVELQFDQFGKRLKGFSRTLPKVQ